MRPEVASLDLARCLAYKSLMLESMLLIAGAYFWGGVPTTYLVARYRIGVDLRAFGSGNVGASNLAMLAGTRAGFISGIIDSIGKGTLPVLLVEALGQNLYVQGGVGIAAVVGHNWSPYIGFSGGRGVATAFGAVLGLYMWRELLIGVFILGLVGRVLFHEVALGVLLAMLITPLFAYMWQPIELVYASSGMVAVIVLKRLVANWTLSSHNGLLRVMMNRLLWDRDVSNREEWVARLPSHRNREA